MKCVDIIDEFLKKKNLESSKLSIDGFIGYKISSQDLISFIQFLKEHKDLRFTILTDLFAADFPERENNTQKASVVNLRRFDHRCSPTKTFCACMYI